MTTNLRDRLALLPDSADPATILRPSLLEPESRAYQALKLRLHRQLLDRIDLAALGSLPEGEQTRRLAQATQNLIAEEGLAISEAERKQLVLDVRHEVIGLGPLEPLMADPTVSDILVNSSRQVYVERRGVLELTNVTFADDAHLMRLIDRIVSRIGRRIDESSPMVDARLADGSRVNVIIPPLALDGPMMSIRRFAVDPLKMEDLVRNGALLAETAELLTGIIRAKINLVISGGTGSGKTTLLNAIIHAISILAPHDRLVVIEDTGELQCAAADYITMRAFSGFSMNECLKSTMRFRPDRIIVGEVRGGEAMALLKSWNTGHEGGAGTLHANSGRLALSRLQSLIAEAPEASNYTPEMVSGLIGEAVNVVIFMSKDKEAKGGRTVKEIISVDGFDAASGEYRVQTI